MLGKAIFPISLGLVIAVLSISYGFQYLFTGSAKVAWFSTFTVVFCVALVFLGIFAKQTKKGPPTPDNDTIQIAGPALCFTSLALSVFFNSPTLVALLVIGVIAALTVILWTRWGALLTARGLFFLAMCLGAYHISQTPLDPQAADMLTIIQAAGAHFLNGSSPYGEVFPGASTFPFVYLPGTWFPYLPLIALDLDPRILNIAGLLILAILAEATAQKAGNKTETLSVAVYPILMSPMMAQALVYGQIWPYWIMAALMGYLLLCRRLVPAALVLGLMLATRQWAVFFAWPLAAYFAGRLPLKEFIKLALVITAGFLLLMLPMFIFDPNLFQVAFVDVAKSAPGAFLNEKVTSQVGLVALMSTVGVTSAPILLMGLVAIISGVIAYRSRHASPEWFLYFMGMAYLILVTCNFQVFRYYYIPGLWFIAIGYIAIMSQTLDKKEEASSVDYSAQKLYGDESIHSQPDSSITSKG